MESVYTNSSVQCNSIGTWGAHTSLHMVTETLTLHAIHWYLYRRCANCMDKRGKKKNMFNKV